MKMWKPINFKGALNYDPRGELADRIKHAEQANDSYVAVPLELAQALADLRECHSSTTLTGDEDGPLPQPLAIFCSKVRDHRGSHSNGYCSWEES